MDISQARCTSCDTQMVVSRMACPSCDITLEGEVAIPALARLAPEDQMFVIAFVRHHGSIKKMERLLGISYPTVKNRLHAITAQLDRSFRAPSSRIGVLEELERGEISVDQALERLES